MAKQLFKVHQEFLDQFYPSYIRLSRSSDSIAAVTEHKNNLNKLNGKHYQRSCDLITQSLHQDNQAVDFISTWFNLNHEIHHYVRYLLTALVAKKKSDI